ncbi:MAG: F0F1 ATP synthase subunit delta [Candidatus Omnitrophota bacterium]
MIIQLIIFQILTFAAIVLFLRFFFSRNVNAALRRLKELQNENQLIEAKLKAMLEQAEKETAEKLEKAKAEAKKITDEAVTMGKILQRNQEDKGKIEADNMINDAKEKVKKLHSELMLRINAFALKYAVEVIKYTISKRVTDRVHYELINDVIEEISKVDKEKFSIKTNKVEIITNIALTDEELGRLRVVLFSKLENNVEIDQKIDPAMLGGMILRIGAFVINGTLENKLEKVAQMFERDKKLIEIEQQL